MASGVFDFSGSVDYERAEPGRAEVVRVDDGLGAVRGLAFALLFHCGLAAMGFAGWGLWHLLR